MCVHRCLHTTGAGNLLCSSLLFVLGELVVFVFVFSDVHIPQEQGICYVLLFVFLLGESVVFVCVFADVCIQ